MKMIILAAGQGTRLRPLTNDKPKCMVKYRKKPIIDYILKTAKECNIKDIAIISGYKEDVLKEYLKDKNLRFFSNKNYAKTNMLYTLFCAKEFMDDDIIISYSDIVYNKEILKKLIKAKGDFCVVVDKEWKKLWQKRFENPLDDAETLKIKNNYIVEIGKKPKDYSEIEAQYIGLIKISKNTLPTIVNFYEKIENKENLYLTDFIQKLIDNNISQITPVIINGGWIEIDNIKDLNIS